MFPQPRFRGFEHDGPLAGYGDNTAKWLYHPTIAIRRGKRGIQPSLASST